MAGKTEKKSSEKKNSGKNSKGKGGKKQPKKEVIHRVIPDITGNNAIKQIDCHRRKGNLTQAFLRYMAPLMQRVVNVALVRMGTRKTAKLPDFQNFLSDTAHDLNILRIEAAKTEAHKAIKDAPNPAKALKAPKAKKAAAEPPAAPPGDEAAAAELDGSAPAAIEVTVEAAEAVEAI
jgi:hypothetical protein